MTTPPQLAPPGAGLPAWELAGLRVIRRLVSAAWSDEGALRIFRGEADRMLELADSVPPELAARPVLIPRVTGIEDSSRNWSLFMVLDHLCIVNRGTLTIIQHLNREHEYEREVRIEEVKPSPGAGQETIARFRKNVADYLRGVREEEILSRARRHPHPWFGPMTAHEWHCLAAAHHILHRRQMERIAARL